MHMPRPNILLAIADDLSWPHLSAYGCRFVNSPHTDRVAREGVLFHNCFTTAPTCTASRGSLLTGLYPWQLEEGCQLWGLLPHKYKTYPDMLEEAGYFIGLTNKGWGPGSVEASGRTRNPAGPAFDDHRCTPLTSCMNSNDYATNFKAFMDQKPDGRPFCFWYGSKEPHRKYEKGSGLKHGKRLEDVDVPAYLPDCDEVRSDMLDYALEVERFDDDLGQMIVLLEEREELENTIIVVTGDNGFPFPRAKATVYQNGCHVPLAVRWGSNCPPGRAVTDFISFADFASTLVEAAGLDPNTLPFTGRSFLDVVCSDAAGRIDGSRDHVFTGRERHGYNRPDNLGYPMRSIVTDDYLYIHNFEPENGAGDVDGSPTKDLIWNGKEDPELKRYWELTWGLRPHDELYTAAEGPDCIENVAADPEYHEQVAGLRERLFNALRAQGDPRMAGRGWVFDCFPYFGTPHMDKDRFANREYNYYQKRCVPDSQRAPIMNATAAWAKWI